MLRRWVATSRSYLWALLPTLMIVVVTLVAQAAVADPDGDLSAQKSHVDRALAQQAASLEYATARAQEAHRTLTSTAAQLPTAREAVAAARGAVIASETAAREARRVADEAAADYEESNAAFGKAHEAVMDEQGRLDAFARESYASGQNMIAAAVLAVQSPEGVVAAVGYMQGLAALRDAAVKRTRIAQLAAGQERASMKAAKRKADEAEKAAQASLTEARAREGEAAAAEIHLAALVTQAQEASVVAEEERLASEARYRELQAESDRLAVALREAAAAAPAAGAPAQASGHLLMPVYGWVSSSFGSRFDPYYGRWQLHAGTDFAAPGGAPIKVAAAGKVIRTGWNGGYGMYTCVYHGWSPRGGLSTCYAHQSAILVSAGQWVGAGEVIGRVGTTGASTGNHLHFEVRLDGVPVDPMGWL